MSNKREGSHLGMKNADQKATPATTLENAPTNIHMHSIRKQKKHKNVKKIHKGRVI